VTRDDDATSEEDDRTIDDARRERLTTTPRRRARTKQPDVVTKYKIAADCANAAMKEVRAAIAVGAKVVDLCALGDAAIERETAKYYNKKDKDGNKVEKGIAFPTCVSIDNCVCHNSPDASDAKTIEDGASVKIDLGAHVDGYVATTATTVVVGGKPVTGAQADVMKAAELASEIVIRKLRPGASTGEIGGVIEGVAKDFGVNVVEGVMTHNMKRFIIDGNKVILNKSTPEMKADPEEIELYEVYALDIVMSSGEGKPKQRDERETKVYKRAIEKNYQLKMQGSRAVFSEISKRFPTMPFTARALEEKRVNFGLVECCNHGLLHAYPVLYEKDGAAVAHVKSTFLVLKKGNDRITTFEPQEVQSDKSLSDNALVELIATELKPKPKPKKKK
jgi:methionyl aminopeptidase